MDIGGSAAWDARDENRFADGGAAVSGEEQFIQKEAKPMKDLKGEKGGAKQEKENAPPAERSLWIGSRPECAHPPLHVTGEALEAKDKHSVIEDQLPGKDVVKTKPRHPANPDTQ